MSDAPTEDQRARWLKHPLRKIHYNEVEYIDLCAAITADAVQAERARLAASGEMTNEEIDALLGSGFGSAVDVSVSPNSKVTVLNWQMTAEQARDFARALITESAARATRAERERCAKVCDELRHPDYSQESPDWIYGTEACGRAIRAGEGE